MQYNKEEVEQELRELLGECYDSFAADMIDTLEKGYLDDEKIWTRDMIEYVKSKGVKVYEEDDYSIEDMFINRVAIIRGWPQLHLKN